MPPPSAGARCHGERRDAEEPVVVCTPLTSAQSPPSGPVGGVALRRLTRKRRPVTEVRDALLGHHDRDVFQFPLLSDCAGLGLVGACRRVPSLAGGASVVLGSRLNVLLLAAPLALWGHRLGAGDAVVFLTALLAIVPCAERLGFVTELLANHTNDTVGGLLNATFGNATEVIVCWYALKKGLTRVVQLSLLGSILSNLLLVLGFSCLVGGLRWKVQAFKVVSGAVPTAMLMLATSGLLLPCALRMSGQEDDSSDEINFSRFSSVVMILMYAGFLVFQLRTHTEEFEGEDTRPPPGAERGSSPTRPPRRGEPDRDARYNGADADAPRAEPADKEGGEPAAPALPPTAAAAAAAAETSVLGMWDCVFWMLVITLTVSALSDKLVETIEGFTQEWRVNSVFISAVIIPVVGNAAEHAAAVVFAFRNRMDICMGIAVGSSTQIALLVLPGCVLLGWAMQRSLSLFFNGFETAALFSSVLTVTAVLHGGSSNWLLGLLLIGAYLIIACGFWVHELENLSSVKGLPEAGARRDPLHNYIGPFKKAPALP